MASTNITKFALRCSHVFYVNRIVAKAGTHNSARICAIRAEVPGVLANQVTCPLGRWMAV